MDIIIFLPCLFTLLALIFRSPERVFQNVYLPILILLPQNFTFHRNRIPEIAFAQAAILPLFALGFFARVHRWKWSLCDFIILVFFIENIYSEFVTEGLGSTAQLISNGLTNMVFPYMLAKVLIHPGGYTVSVAKTITMLVYTNILLSLYEQRFMVNPYINFFQTFFPGQGYAWPTIERYGFVRIAGPFIQTILFAISCSIAFFLNYWLLRNNYWEPHYRYIPDLPIKKGWLFAIVIFLGLIFTFSRGPLLSLAMGFIFVGIAFSKYPWPSFFCRIVIFSLISLVISEVYTYYSDVGIELSTSDQAMTLSYRTALIQKYSEIMWQKPWFGWGVNSWPKVASTISIDNQYLWLTLKHGFLASWMLGFMMVYIVLRLLKRGFMLPLSFTRERTLDFVFLGLYLTLIFSFATVYMGLQIEALFYILTGWIEGYVHTPPKDNAHWDSQVAKPQKYMEKH